MQNLMSMLTDPKVLTGIIALVVLGTIFLLAISAGGRRRDQAERIDKHNRNGGPESVKRELTAEILVYDLLSDRRWRTLSFDVLTHHIGGFKDDELRKLLVAAGAVRMNTGAAGEQWGLLERNRRRLGVKLDVASQDPANAPAPADTTAKSPAFLQRLTSVAGMLKSAAEFRPADKTDRKEPKFGDQTAKDTAVENIPKAPDRNASKEA